MLEFLETVQQKQFRLVFLDHETENETLEHSSRFRGKSNGWELKCGDENFINVHCFKLLSFLIAKLVKIHRPEVPSLLATG